LVAELAAKLFTDEVKAAYTASLPAAEEPAAEESSEE
jgi:hypothetical protein